MWPELASDLERLKSLHLYRNPEIFSERPPFINFSSNDYLGLAQHPRVIRQAAQAAKKWGTGSGASRLLSGNLKIHLDLEKKIAQFKKEEASLIFSSGYLANLGAVTGLVNEKDVVFVDRLNHASLIDAARLSRAKLRVYAHRDLGALQKVLERSKSFRRRLVLTDAYFSMDGTVAPLDKLLDVCERNDAWLMVDEAHSTGVYGRTGRGLTEHFGISGKVPVVMGTLSKALGSVGGFISGRALLRDTLVNTAREFIYTTAPSPPASAAAMEALELIEKKPLLRKKLWNNTTLLRGLLEESGYDLMGSEGPIVPMLIGDTARTLRMKEYLKKAGFFVPAIRPPTVSKGTDRLRLSVTASHTPEEIKKLCRALKKCRDKS